MVILRKLLGARLNSSYICWCFSERCEAQPSLRAQVIRSNDVMYKAGQTEMVILRKLSGADPNGKRHCVRMLRSFEYRQHLCLVFENMVSAPAAPCRSTLPWSAEHVMSRFGTSA